MLQHMQPTVFLKHACYSIDIHVSCNVHGFGHFPCMLHVHARNMNFNMQHDACCVDMHVLKFKTSHACYCMLFGVTMDTSRHCVVLPSTWRHL